MVKSKQNRKGAISVCILQHIHCETLGLILDCLKSAGIEMRFVRVFEGNPIPSNLHAQAGLIVMGGPMSVYDHKQFPFLLDEQRLIEQALKDDKPVLGICLGSQLLAATLGAEVKSGAKKEIGWHPVALTKAAKADALWEGVPPRFMAYHWHGDVFELPQGTVPLASSELTTCQGFRYGANAYGFLFHMEVTEKIIQSMVREFSEELDEENIEARTIIQRTRDHHQNLQAIGTKVFRRWTKLIKF